MHGGGAVERQEAFAHAKLNLTLDVLGERSDGYHDMCMVMQSVTLRDCLSLHWGGNAPLNVKSTFRFLPGDARNLAAKAALRFWAAAGLAPEPLTIELEKHIPMCAGMAGGSSDAAAVLRALNEHYAQPLTEERLQAVAAEIGSDVPFCLLGGTALAESRGEKLTPLPHLPPCWLVLCKPGFSVSTPELFGRIGGRAKNRRRPDTAGVLTALEEGDLSGVARRLYNVFEDVLPDRHAATVREVEQTLIYHGALGAAMSGTGSTVFGIFAGKAEAQSAFNDLSARYAETFLSRPV